MKKINFQRLLRTAHFYSSLVCSLFLLFYTFTGILLSFSNGEFDVSDLKYSDFIRSNEELNLNGFEQKFGAQLKKNSLKEGKNSSSFILSKKNAYDFEVFVDKEAKEISYKILMNRSYDSTEAIIRYAQEKFSDGGKASSIEEDDEYIYFDLKSVWKQYGISYEKASGQYDVNDRKFSLYESLTRLHRGENKSGVQDIIIKVLSIMTLFVVFSGIYLSSPNWLNSKKVLRAVSLISISLVLIIYILYGR